MATLMAAMGLFGCVRKAENKGESVPDDGTFVIEGRLPAERYDSACLYLVPMQGPHPRPVDSTFVARDGSFRFEGNIEQMAVLRLDYHRRMGIQDLLVVTEPGVTHVILDSVSSSCGTLQNDSLQAFKDRMEYYNKQVGMLAMMRNAGQLDDQNYHMRFDQVRDEMGDWGYRFCKGLGRRTLSIYYFNHLFAGRLDDVRRTELGELLKDTIDYTLPQPGFHR